MLATLAAGLFFAGHVMAADKVAPATTKAADVKCSDVNDCKGKGACKSKENACKGENSCKGKGWTSMSAADCTAKGGKAAK